MKINPLVVVFVLIDTCCLYLYTKEMGLPLPMAIISSLLFAAALDALSYAASFYGVGQLLKIPKIDLQEISEDRNNARIISVLACVAVIVFQGLLIYIRYEQINDKNNNLNSALEEYNSTIQDKSVGDRGRIEKPEYAGNLMMDYVSIIVPIATTILSFVIGLKSVKKYDKFEREAEKIKIEIQKIQKKSNELCNKAYSYIDDLQRPGNIVNLKERMVSYIEEKDNGDLGNFSKELEENLEKRAPELYEGHIKTLVAVLKGISKNIGPEFSKKAKHQNSILKYDLEEDFKVALDELGNTGKKF